MKNMSIFFSALSLVVLVGCNSTPGSFTKTTVILGDDNTASTESLETILVGNVIKPKIVIQLADMSKDKQFGARVRVASEGNLADKVTVNNSRYPYISVNLDSSLSQFDKTGNFYIHEGKSTLTINRFDGKLLSSKAVSTKGDRTLSEAKSISVTASSLGQSIATEISAIAERTAKNVELAKVSFSISSLQKILGDDIKVKTNSFIKQVKAKPGIIVCALTLETETEMEFIIAYEKDVFQQGIALGKLFTKKVHSNDPVAFLVDEVLISE